MMGIDRLKAFPAGRPRLYGRAAIQSIIAGRLLGDGDGFPLFIAALAGRPNPFILNYPHSVHPELSPFRSS